MCYYSIVNQWRKPIPNSNYYDSLNTIVDELIDDNKEPKITILKRKNGPKKQILFRGSRYA